MTPSLGPITGPQKQKTFWTLRGLFERAKASRRRPEKKGGRKLQRQTHGPLLGNFVWVCLGESRKLLGFVVVSGKAPPLLKKKEVPAKTVSPEFDLKNQTLVFPVPLGTQVDYGSLQKEIEHQLRSSKLQARSRGAEGAGFSSFNMCVAQN